MSTQRDENAINQTAVRLGLAVACGVVGIGLLLLYEQQMLLKRSGGEPVSILAAKTEIKAGGRVTVENIDVQRVPRAYVHTNAVSSDVQRRVLGRRVSSTLKAGQPLLWTDFAIPDQERIQEPLAKGLRVTPINIGEHLARSRFLSSGDFMDILIHFNRGEEKGSLTTTLLQHIQVLELHDNTAVLALTPEQLEQVTFAHSHGTLTFALRNYKDIETVDLSPTTFWTLLGKFAAKSPAPRTRSALPSSQVKSQTPPPAERPLRRSSRARSNQLGRAAAL